MTHRTRIHELAELNTKDVARRRTIYRRAITQLASGRDQLAVRVQMQRHLQRWAWHVGRRHKLSDFDLNADMVDLAERDVDLFMSQIDAGKWDDELADPSTLTGDMPKGATS